MEKTIFEEAVARLKGATAIAHFAAQGQAAPATLAWYEGQYDNALETEGVVTYPFDCPAIFLQFSKETEYSGANRKKFEGELTAHVVQSKLALDGLDGAASHAAWKLLLAYAESVVDLLDGYKLPCSARLLLAGVTRDHVNRPLMVDLVRFTFTGSQDKATVQQI